MKEEVKEEKPADKCNLTLALSEQAILTEQVNVIKEEESVINDEVLSEIVFAEEPIAIPDEVTEIAPLEVPDVPATQIVFLSNTVEEEEDPIKIVESQPAEEVKEVKPVEEVKPEEVKPVEEVKPTEEIKEEIKEEVKEETKEEKHTEEVKEEVKPTKEEIKVPETVVKKETKTTTTKKQTKTTSHNKKNYYNKNNNKNNYYKKNNNSKKTVNKREK